MTRQGRFRFSTGTQVVVGLVLGLATGLFFGEAVGFFKDIGKAFILLLQMTVLPYITLSLITGLGHLTYQQVKQLVRKAGAALRALPFRYHNTPPLCSPGWSASLAVSMSPCPC